MEVIYGIIPGMLILGLVMVGVFFWAARSGQFDDMEGDAQRILMDEDLPRAGDKPVEAGQQGEAAHKSTATGTTARPEQPERPAA